LAGSADFKTELSQSNLFDPRLQTVIMAVVDVSYGGENGLNQAIELSAETLANVKFVQEKRLLSSFFEQISQDTGKFVFGMKDTLVCLDMGAVETLIVWENFDMQRYVFTNTITGVTEIKFLRKDQESESKHFKDPNTNINLEITDKQPMLEWLANNYKKFGCLLEFVTDCSEEGNQFCKGFGGIGGVLRYSVNLNEFEEPDVADDDSLWSEEEDLF